MEVCRTAANSIINSADRQEGLSRLCRGVRTAVGATLIFACAASVYAQNPDDAKLRELKSELQVLQQRVGELAVKESLQSRSGRQRLADVSVFAKAVEWQLRHNEFPKKGYADQASVALQLGNDRADMLAAGNAPWEQQEGATIRGYFSRIDGSVQPYALRLPNGVDPDAIDRWPLYVKLHGRANDMNETNFIFRHEGKGLEKGQTWIQLDVYGRGNNAYRWAGETDVFEAIQDVQRRFRIDSNRITLHGFSMGGAGAWHLGLHFPAMWSSVGPGAGFVDFYRYQKQTELRPPWQHANLGIYDAVDYSLNAFNVPVCTYGGEKDAQLLASTSVHAAAKKLGVELKMLIGPGMGHRFHPDSYVEFMAFHKKYSTAGRQRGYGRKKIRFTTRTLKYNSCDWLAVEEMLHVYQPATVEAEMKDGDVVITTNNVAVLKVARDAGSSAIIDGDYLPCNSAGGGLLPDVYYERVRDGWAVQSYDESKNWLSNPATIKRHNLQGPIDDAFMESFVCVLPTGQTRNSEHAQWAQWTYDRFAKEYDKWLRGSCPSVKDTELSEAQIQDSNLILFGDPESNAVMARVLEESSNKFPLRWEDGRFVVAGKPWDASEYGASFVFPSPLNRNRYVVFNSGYTFHEKDFKASNSWLFPRLGDIAVQKLVQKPDGSFDEETVFAENFNSGWLLPVRE